MAMYFGNFISRIPFLQNVECDLRMLVPEGNLVTGLMYPLIGWAYNSEHFVGVFETDLGVNCFEITAENKTKSKPDHSDGYDNETEEESLRRRVEGGNLKQTGYAESLDFTRLDIKLVPYYCFEQAAKTADFDSFYINKKKVDKIVKRNQKRCDELAKDFNVLAKFEREHYDPEGQSRSYYGHRDEGMKTTSPFYMLLAHKDNPHCLYTLTSPDQLYKTPQLKHIQTITKDRRPYSDLLELMRYKTIRIYYDDPVVTGSGYSSISGDMVYTIALEASEVATIMKPALKTLFNYVTPSRKPILAITSSYRGIHFLSRFKNERLVGSRIYLDSGRKFGSTSQGSDESSIARDFLRLDKEGKLNTYDCMVLDDEADLDALKEECQIYELTGALGGL